MAEKPKKPGLWSRYVGGLLGEDYESMSPEERRSAGLSVLGVIARGMASPEAGAEALRLTRAGRAAERESAGLARRQAAAEALMPQVVGRLFGGPAGRLESLPGGEGGELTSRYRQDPRSALAALYGSQAGRDLSQMAPDLAKLATEGTLGRTVGGSVYNPLTGGFTAPPREAGTTTLSPDEVRRLGAPPGTIIQRDPSGKLTVVPVPRAAVGGAAPRAAVGSAAPGAPGAPSGAPGGAAMPPGILPPEQARALGFREGSVVYIDPKTGKPQVLQAGPTGPAAAAATGAPGAPGAGNERQQSGRQMTRQAALQYAANITGEPLSKIQGMSPAEIEALMVQKGGRVMQGARARMLSGLPLIGDFGRAVVESVNADLMAPANQGGAGIAMQQNPTGAITAADVDAGRAQFPNAMYPIDVQAQMIRTILEQGGQVEEYDAKGNKVR
jgi:hypothetical protein